MNGDQGTTNNNAFLNIHKKKHHSQGMIFLLILYYSIFCRKIKSKVIPC